MKGKKIEISLILIIVGFLILFLNNDIALMLKDMYLSDKGFGEIMETQIFENYSNMILIIGGILFYRGIYRLTN